MGKRRAWYVVATAIIIGGLIYGFFALNGNGKKSASPVTVKPPSASSPAQPEKTTKLAHIFLIVEENQTYGSIVGNPSAPYINSLIKSYSLATNYQAVAHPSLPNYIAMTSGSTDGITTDCNPPSAGCIVNVNNLADELEKVGLSWKEYAESMPSACYAFNAGNYATKHNPFVYYADIINNQARCDAHVEPLSQLASDLKSATTTPNFAFITPNLCDDMHDCGIAPGDSWLANNVPAILNSPAFTKQNSLLVITWDEGNASDNHIATIFAGPGAKNGYQSATAYNHYSLLHTIEANWSLSGLTTNDKGAPLMNDMLK